MRTGKPQHPASSYVPKVVAATAITPRKQRHDHSADWVTIPRLVFVTVALLLITFYYNGVSYV